MAGTASGGPASPLCAAGDAEFALETQLRPQAPEPDIWLAFALLKRDATDLVVQKATELGVAALLPVVTERTNAARLNDARLAAIAIEAAEQCERLTVPTLHARRPTVPTCSPPGRRTGACSRRSNAATRRICAPRRDPAALLIGPEGGFTRPSLKRSAGIPL